MHANSPKISKQSLLECAQHGGHFGRRFDASEGSSLQIHEVVDHIKDVDGFELLIGTEL